MQFTVVRPRVWPTVASEARSRARRARAGDAVRSGTDYRGCVAVQASPYAISSRKHPGFTGGISRALSRHLLDAEAGADGCIRGPCRAPGDPAGTVGMPRDGEEKTRRETTSASAQAAQSRFSIAARRAFPWQFERDRHTHQLLTETAVCRHHWSGTAAQLTVRVTHAHRSPL